MRISDWSSDVCSSDLPVVVALVVPAPIVTLPRSFCWTLVESGPCARTGPASAKTNERKSAAILISSPHGVAAGFLLQRASVRLVPGHPRRLSFVLRYLIFLSHSRQGNETEGI